MIHTHRRAAGYMILLAAVMLLSAGCQMLEPEATPSPAEAEAMVEQAIAANQLAATAWDLDYIGATEEPVELLPDSRASLAYFWDRYAGFDGCNWFLGVYSTTAEGELRMNTPSRTQTVCAPEELYQQSLLVTSALQNATAYELADEQLMVNTVDEQRLLTFNPAALVPMLGTEWELKFWWNGQREAWVPVIPESTTSITFAEGDEASGSAGCNNYTVGYEGELQADKVAEASGTDAKLPALTFGPAAVQMLECTEPEGIMEQEMSYLTTLTSVTQYVKAGGMVLFLDANGTPLLMFGARN